MQNPTQTVNQAGTVGLSSHNMPFNSGFIKNFSFIKQYVWLSIIIFDCPLKPSDLPNCRVTVWGNPYTSKVVCIDLVLNELPSALFMYIYAPSLSMVNFTSHYCRVGICLHFKSCYPVSVDVAAFKVALKRKAESQDTKTKHFIYPKTKTNGFKDIFWGKEWSEVIIVNLLIV